MSQPGSSFLLRVVLSAVLAVFFASNFALVVLHQRFARGISETTDLTRQILVTSICEDLERRPPQLDPESIAQSIRELRAKYPGIVDARLTVTAGSASPGPGPAVAPRGSRVDRRLSYGLLTLYFDTSLETTLFRTTRLVSIVSVIAIAAGVLLVVLNLVTIPQPLNELLSKSGELGERNPRTEERKMLIDGFQTAIGTLRTHEQELKRLHALEKSRADEFAQVTSALTRNITSGFISFDPAGKVFEMNQEARSMLAVTADEKVAGRDVGSLIGDSSFSRLLRRATEARTSLQRHEIPHDVAKPLSIGLTTVPLFNGEDSYLGMLALITDLTPIRNLEKRLREMQTLADLGEMSAGIAHEFRNSLATILGYLKLAHRSTADPEVARKLNEAESEARALNDAVMGLLNFARPMALDLRPVDVAKLLGELAGRLVSPETGIKLETTLEPFTIAGDPALLARALENLLRNAIEAVEMTGRADGVIRVAATAGETPSIRIEDNGVGIDPADVPRLILPFHSGKPSGLGLGLPLARKIVLLHGGNVSLTGTPGVGTTVDVVFGLDTELPEIDQPAPRGG